jgi:hypothetical protein
MSLNLRTQRGYDARTGARTGTAGAVNAVSQADENRPTTFLCTRSLIDSAERAVPISTELARFWY